MAGERAGHSLQPTALVNEAYLRLIDVQHVNWQNRAHFLAMAARVMRRVLVEAARTKRAQKRGGRDVRVTFVEELPVTGAPGQDVIALDASAAADVQHVYWFDGNALLGRHRIADGAFGWRPTTAGVHLIRIVDDHGRSAERDVDVEFAP